MIDINKIIEQAVEKDATDIHLMLDSKPMYRIGNSLVKMQGGVILNNKDMDDIYNHFTKGNTAKKIFVETKTLDTVYEYKGINLGINLSFANKIPVYTMKILKNKLPEYEELNLPDILRKMTYQTQGLILIAGNKKSGKTTTLNALVRHINETQNKKIITLEKAIEYSHTSRNSIIVQKELGTDFERYQDGVKNALKEDCDVLVIEDIRNRETMEAVLENVEAGHLVIAGINTRSCTDAIDKIINLYNLENQSQIKYSLATSLKLIISQKLLLGTKGKLELLSEVMVVDSKIKDIFRKQNIELTDFEEIIQNSHENGSISLINSLASLYVENKITLKQAKSQIEEKDMDILNKTIMKMRIKK